jgi:hypothetical protein
MREKFVAKVKNQIKKFNNVAKRNFEMIKYFLKKNLNDKILFLKKSQKS